MKRLFLRKKILIISLFFFVFILTFTVVIYANIDYTGVLHFWQYESLSKTIIDVFDNKIPIYHGPKEYYITNANEFSRKYPLYIAIKNNIKNKLIEINDTVYEVFFKSSASEIATINENGVITFLNEGNVTFTITIGDSSVKIPFEVKEGPFITDFLSQEEITTEDLVRKLGFPDNKTSTFIEWPDRSAILDNISYTFSSKSTNNIRLVHWHYNEYPNLLFRIYENKKLSSIYNKGWDCGYDFTVEYALGYSDY
jgi:hypothetical protein